MGILDRKIPFYIFFALLIVIAIYIRVQGVGDYYYSEDESFHIRMAQGKDLKEVLQFSLYETHPPLGNIIRHYWLKISEQIWFARSLSLLFGIALIPLYYLIGKKLNGKLTGICAAILMTFSYGCIIQSFVARNYTTFLFFLSSAFYFYLLWQDNRQNKTLLGYFVFSALACLTHLYGIFAIFTIASYSSVKMFVTKEDGQSQSKWAIVNILVAIIFLTVIFIWKNTSRLDGAFYILTIEDILQIPIRITFYIISNSKIIVISMIILYLKTNKGASLQHLLYLSLISIFIAMIAAACGMFVGMGSRHDLWMLPFILIIASIIIAGTIDKLNVTKSALIIGLIFCELLLYDPTEKFNDPTEYTTFSDEWQQFEKYTDTLNRNSIIIVDRDDAILPVNIYNYLGQDAFIKGNHATLIPYKKTGIIINPYIRHIYQDADLIDSINQANQKHFLDKVDKLVFLRLIPDELTKKKSEAVKDLLFMKLLNCQYLEKEVISLYPNGSLKLFSVNKNTFFEYIQHNDGKPSLCKP